MHCSFSLPRPLQKTRAAFTLVELLVAVTVIAVLVVMAFAGTHAAMQQVRKTREIAAAKTLITAYLAYPADNDGQLLPGADHSTSQIQLPDGNAIHGPTVQRYPYRLASYFNYTFEGTTIINRNASQYDTSDTYLVSLYPALGINHNFVGGSRGMDGLQTNSAECVTSILQGGAGILVFVSASNGEPDKDKVEGYCYVTPPNLYAREWSSSAAWTNTASSKQYGHVDARHGGRAVAAFLDGSVRLHTVEELDDMRLWNANAAAQDDSKYMAKKPGGGGRR